MWEGDGGMMEGNTMVEETKGMGENRRA